MVRRSEWFFFLSLKVFLWHYYVTHICMVLPDRFFKEAAFIDVTDRIIKARKTIWIFILFCGILRFTDGLIFIWDLWDNSLRKDRKQMLQNLSKNIYILPQNNRKLSLPTLWVFIGEDLNYDWWKIGKAVYILQMCI